MGGSEGEYNIVNGHEICYNECELMASLIFISAFDTYQSHSRLQMKLSNLAILISLNQEILLIGCFMLLNPHRLEELRKLRMNSMIFKPVV